jgi:hypothetical protein
MTRQLYGCNSPVRLRRLLCGGGGSGGGGGGGGSAGEVCLPFLE